jgi:hypothetical protein
MHPEMPTSVTEMQPPPGRLRRRQSRYRLAGEIDRRTRGGRRATELMQQFESELGNDITPGQRLAVSRAAVLVAVAEDARLRRLAGEAVPLDDVVRCDRLAAQAVRALGIKLTAPAKAAPSLAQIIAEHEAAE